jgi:hypothetical protein
MATSFSGGRNQSTRREPPTMGKQLVNCITCGCESSAPFCNLQRRARTHAVLVICLYELLGDPTTYLIEPPGPSPWSRFELTTSVVIGTDCIGSWKSNYHTITATTAPDSWKRYLNNIFVEFVGFTGLWDW